MWCTIPAFLSKHGPCGTLLGVDPQTIAIILSSAAKVTASEDGPALLEARGLEWLEQELPQNLQDAVERHRKKLLPLRPSFVEFQQGTLEALMIREAWMHGESGCTAKHWDAAVRKFAVKSGNRDYRTLKTVPRATLTAVRRNCNEKLSVIGLQLAPRKPPTLIPLRQKKKRR